MLHQEGKTIVCPYNTAHLIRQTRMQTHLVKCRKNYPTQDFDICPVDSTHHVPRQEYTYHLENCPKRGVVDSALYEQVSEQNASVPSLSRAVVQSLLPPSEESWDDDSAPTYDPIANCKDRNIIRTLKNAPPAEKREFQLAERRRLIALQEKIKINAPLQKEPQLRVDQNDDSVRMPRNQSLSVVASQETMQSGK